MATMSSRPIDTAPASWSQYEAVHEIRLAGIRSRHPETSHRQAVAQLAAEDHGVALPRQT
jgi:hypothetical protein